MLLYNKQKTNVQNFNHVHTELAVKINSALNFWSINIASSIIKDYIEEDYWYKNISHSIKTNVLKTFNGIK